MLVKYKQYSKFLWIAIIGLFVIGYITYDHYKKKSDVDFGMILQKYTDNKITTAREVIKDIFPDTDINEYPLLCTEHMNNKYNLESGITRSLITLDGTILPVQFSSPKNLYYYPYYIILVHKSKKRLKYASISEYFDHDDVSFIENNHRITISQKDSDYIYSIQPILKKTHCVKIDDLLFSVEIKPSRFNNSRLGKFYGFIHKDQEKHR